jgi:hypothetical protein
MGGRDGERVGGGRGKKGREEGEEEREGRKEVLGKNIDKKNRYPETGA